MKITKIVQKHINTHGANWWQVNLKVGGGEGVAYRQRRFLVKLAGEG